MQFGVVYLARAKGNRTRLLAVKTMKPGKVSSYGPCLSQPARTCCGPAVRGAWHGMQESDGISPTAIRELMLRELKHEHIIHLDSVHLNRQARQSPPVQDPGAVMQLCHHSMITFFSLTSDTGSAGPVPLAGV